MKTGYKQPVEILKEEWDYLIILDACRYDYFEKYYSDYIEGSLCRKLSVGSATNEWIKKNFVAYYDDIVYLTANPRIASNVTVLGFSASEHFARVYDIWCTGWNNELGTVLPQTVTDFALRTIPEIHGKRIIIHYLQPHAPYLSLGMSSLGFTNPEDIEPDEFLSGWKNPNQKSFRYYICKKAEKYFKQTRFLGDHPAWYLRQWLLLPPVTPMDAARRKVGIRGLRKAYEANLKIVLSEVRRLIQYLSGRIIVTSDHGELLGENKCFTHMDGSENPFLREIPWLIINKKSSAVPPTFEKNQHPDPNVSDKNQDEAVIQERLRALGYID